ncbi:hypothetical protein [Amycolatopsis sp. lyj-112]|uniref:hypothetical protein n=1 Tax=Amycolatopsis sp. lyj-112 TaxID=2789288 RepID=UPI00397B5C63
MWLNRRKPKYEMDKALRDELRTSIEDLSAKIKEQDLRIDALEVESASWQARALDWYQRYKMLKVKALEVLISHGVSLEKAQLALQEDNEEWLH